MFADLLGEHEIENDPLLMEGKRLGATISVYKRPAFTAAQVLTPTQILALEYFTAYDLNVFPQPFGKKKGTIWRKVQFTRLHPTHENYGLLAVTVGRCNLAVMVGRTSGGFFVIDCESESRLQWVIQNLREHHIPIWAVRTRRGGHLWLRIADGVVRSIPPDEMARRGLSEMELRGNTGYVLVPPSVVNGHVYDWICREGETIPLVAIETLDFIPNVELMPKAKALPKRYASPFWKSTQEYLLDGRTYPEGIRHKSFYNALANYACCGLSASDMWRDLVPIAQASGLPDKDDPYYFNRQINAALRNITPQKKNTLPLLAWQRAEQFVTNYNWSGRTGTTDLKLALALIERAKTFSNENGTFRASQRELGSLGRVSNRQTISKSLERLKAIPFVCYAGTAKSSDATLWRFSDKVLSSSIENPQTEPLQLNTVLRNSTGSVLERSDALERGALGLNGYIIWRALLKIGQAANKAKIASASGMTVKQVDYALRKGSPLRTAGLVTNHRRGNWLALPATDEQLDELIARPFGKLGKGKARRQRFADERAIDAGRAILEHRDKYDRENLNFLSG